MLFLGVDAEIGVGFGNVAALGFEILKVDWLLELFELSDPKDKELKKLEVHFGRTQVSQYQDMFLIDSSVSEFHFKQSVWNHLSHSSHWTQLVLNTDFEQAPQGHLTALGPGLVSTPARIRKMLRQWEFLRSKGGNLGEKMLSLWLGFLLGSLLEERQRRPKCENLVKFGVAEMRSKDPWSRFLMV